MKRYCVPIMLMAGALLLGGCDGKESGGLPTQPPDGASQPIFFVGYYQEDPGRNPEDPTTGVIYVCLPDGDGSFRGQFLFSFVGCTGGMDVGTVRGNKTGDSLSGTWSGDVDGRAIGGRFEGSSTSPGVYSGTYTNSSGKVHVQIGSCEYYVAPRGTWNLYGPDKKDFNLSVQPGNPPRFSWHPVPDANTYLIAVFDEANACAQLNFSTTLMWLAATGKTSVVYGEGLPDVFEMVPDKPLESGKTYVVLVVAIRDDAVQSGTVPAGGIIALSRESFQQSKP